MGQIDIESVLSVDRRRPAAGSRPLAVLKEEAAAETCGTSCRTATGSRPAVRRAAVVVDAACYHPPVHSPDSTPDFDGGGATETNR